MEAASTVNLQGSSNAYRPILYGGLIAGTLDITAACTSSWLRFGGTPVRVLQSVASGLLGQESFNGGFATAALGLVLHFFIATSATAVYYLASRRLKMLVEQPIAWGVLYGIAVWLFMNFIVVPLSAAPFKLRFTLAGVIIGLIIHMLFVGLPIALSVRRFSR
jgi:hypothetical protein